METHPFHLFPQSRQDFGIANAELRSAPLLPQMASQDLQLSNSVRAIFMPAGVADSETSCGKQMP